MSSVNSNGSKVSRYERLLSGPATPGSALESMGAAEMPQADIRARESMAREEFQRIAAKYLPKSDDTQALIDRIIKQGGEGLRMVANKDEAGLARSPAAALGLEAIILTDGSRPSFLLKDNEIDRESSPVSTWGDQLTVNEENLRGLVQRVGRIDVPGSAPGFAGTGFLIQNDLIITNRHVLQVTASQDASDNWKFHDGVAIDFGHELEGIASANRRKLKRVVFVGDKPIVFNHIDHAKLDLALIELESSAEFAAPTFGLSLELIPANGGVDTNIYTIGYPGSPPSSIYPPTLLDQLFASHFGFKRLAPGKLMSSQASSNAWTMAHDATTLGGNSGSIVVRAGVEGFALGLHYGGNPGDPRENWAHRVALIRGQRDGRTNQTLQEALSRSIVAITGTAFSDRTPAARTGGTPAARQPARSPAAAPVARHGATAPRVQPRAAQSRSNWRMGVTLETMQLLTRGGGLEAAGDGHTSATELQNRPGYDPNFVEGTTVPLPMPSSDMRTLRRGGTGVELKYEHFSVIMSESRRMAMVTACNIDGGESRRLPRINTWSYDGRLDDSDQLGNELYQGNDLDRGHMVRREDPVWGAPANAKRANADTFHYTNSCPQMAGVNQVIWLGLENHILSHTRDDQMRVSVFTGPFFTNDDFAYRGVLVPKSFWKIVAFIADNDRFSATAYRVSQEQELSELEFTFTSYKTFQISVQQVIDSTGIDFNVLVPFDGFSQHERVHGTPVVERLDRFDQIRV